MTIPLDPAGLEAAAKAVYEAIPVALKDPVARERAEAAIGIEHGSGVPDTWIARRAVRANFAESLERLACSSRQATSLAALWLCSTP